MDPWTKPIFDIFLEFYSVKELETMIHNNIIEIEEEIKQEVEDPEAPTAWEPQFSGDQPILMA